ncbi:hypothetical protein J7315_21410 [Providencia rettgeri]|uniref:hypothetical protein n=1 Tax=Providencia rettgeri TaxID=587 RepID=UPI001B37F69E|nr:hypothetical protein [Providencia rettgeri]MBQ0688620.1 hypothetical protein [Providencia rettgeri]
MKIKILNDGTYAQLINYSFPIIVDCTSINENKRAFVKSREFGFDSDAFFEFLSCEYEIVHEQKQSTHL